MSTATVLRELVEELDGLIDGPDVAAYENGVRDAIAIVERRLAEHGARLDAIGTLKNLTQAVGRRCDGCPKPIVWALADGKRIPLDTRPAVYQVLAVEPGPEGKVVRAVRNPLAAVTHFATCPHASAFSRSSRR